MPRATTDRQPGALAALGLVLGAASACESETEPVSESEPEAESEAESVPRSSSLTAGVRVAAAITMR